jgi:hypothetical protein
MYLTLNFMNRSIISIYWMYIDIRDAYAGDINRSYMLFVTIRYSHMQMWIAKTIIRIPLYIIDILYISYKYYI